MYKYIKTVTLTPLNADGSAPTLMASSYEHKDWRNAISTSYYPAPLVVEVWEAEEGEQAEHYTDEFVRYIRCGRYRGRKINNAARQKILQAVRELQPNQFIRLRRLTPTEYLRLMDVEDADIIKMLSTGQSDAALYKQGGNSIVVNVLEEIFKHLFINLN